MNACIVLAGGEGRRMGGADKASLAVGGLTLLDRVLAAAAPLCSRLIVVGPTRPTTAVGVIFTLEHQPGGGPVPALFAGFGEATGAEMITVLAVDLPLVSTAGLERLLLAVTDANAGAAAAADERGRPNPLLAVYRAPVLHAAFQVPPEARRGMAASQLLPVDTIVVDLGPRETLNLNTPADLAAAADAVEESPQPPA